MPTYCKATLTFSHDPNDDGRPVGEMSVFNAHLKRPQHYIHTNQIFDLDEMSDGMKSWLQEIDAYIELAGNSLLFWERMSSEQRAAHNLAVLPTVAINERDAALQVMHETMSPARSANMIEGVM